jgi:hypothetical protein
MLLCGSGKCYRLATVWLRVAQSRQLWTVRCEQCSWHPNIEWFERKPMTAKGQP